MSNTYLLLWLGANKVCFSICQPEETITGDIVFERAIDIDSRPEESALLVALETVLEEAVRSVNDAPGKEKLKLYVLVSERWLASAVLPWSRSILGKSRYTFVRSCFAALGVNVPTDSVIRLNRWVYGEPVMAIVFPQSILSAITSFSAKLHATLCSVAPTCLSMWEALHHKINTDVLAIHEGNFAFLVHSEAKYCLQRIVAKNNIVDVRSLRFLCRKFLLRDSRLRNTKVAPVFLRTADPDISDEDPSEVFLPPVVKNWTDIALHVKRRRTSFDAIDEPNSRYLRMVVSIAVMAVCAYSAFLSIQSYRDLRLAEQRLAEVNIKRLNNIRTNSAPINPREIESINSAVSSLNLPVRDLMRALAPPVDIHVSLLSIKSDGDASGEIGRGRLNVTGQAKTSDDMTKYVAYIYDRRPFIGSTLTQHEVVETNPEAPYRFAMTALWSLN